MLVKMKTWEELKELATGTLLTDDGDALSFEEGQHLFLPEMKQYCGKVISVSEYNNIEYEMEGEHDYDSYLVLKLCTDPVNPSQPDITKTINKLEEVLEELKIIRDQQDGK